jgi:hypothetical protein
LNTITDSPERLRIGCRPPASRPMIASRRWPSASSGDDQRPSSSGTAVREPAEQAADPLGAARAADAQDSAHDC